VAALSCPGGIYNVCDDTDPVSHDRFTEATGWRTLADSIVRNGRRPTYSVACCSKVRLLLSCLSGCG
jgi:hypothetical protein